MTDKGEINSLKPWCWHFLYLREQTIGIFRDIMLFFPSVLPMLDASQYLQLANLLSTLLHGKLCTII